jgi:hypothetical protein
MLINLKVIKETTKAYQLEGNGWIPKSVLDNRGLKHPYYQIKGFFLHDLVEKLYGEEDTKIDLQTKLTALSIDNCKINHIDLPLEIREYWKKYWGDLNDSLPPLKISQNKRKSSRSLDHYNDIGAMNDLTFQDVYGD